MPIWWLGLSFGVDPDAKLISILFSMDGKEFWYHVESYQVVFVGTYFSL